MMFLLHLNILSRRGVVQVGVGSAGWCRRSPDSPHNELYMSALLPRKLAKFGLGNNNVSMLVEQEGRSLYACRVVVVFVVNIYRLVALSITGSLCDRTSFVVSNLPLLLHICTQARLHAGKNLKENKRLVSDQRKTSAIKDVAYRTT